MTKESLSLIAIAIAFMAYLPYINLIRKGKVVPHFFTWVIWGASAFIVSLVQMMDGAGVGALPITASSIIVFYIAILAYQKKADLTITGLDKLCFVSALILLVLWCFTLNPLLAVLMITGIDTLGYSATYRKSYSQPFKESLMFFNVIALRNIVVIAALEHYSCITVFFPLVTFLTSMLIVVMIWMRRKSLSNQSYL